MMLDENYISRIPLYTKKAIDRWVNEGCPTGGFVSAVLCNDLIEAISHADQHNIMVLPEIIGYLWNECPAPCWGSREKVKLWRERKLLSLGVLPEIVDGPRQIKKENNHASNPVKS